MKRKNIEAGDVFSTNEGCTALVLEYRKYSEVLIEYQDEHKYQCTVRADHLRSGGIKNPYFKAVLGIGYYGVGKHKAWCNGKHTRAYVKWRNMLTRVYNPKELIKHPIYKNSSVVEDWHNFQNFAEWFYQQPNHEIACHDLDKDLLIPGNKVYRPEACSFVPQQINKLFVYSLERKGDLPVGVSMNGKYYQVNVSNGNEMKYIGTYHTVTEAEEVYKREKKKVAIEAANKYKDQILPEVYRNIINWEF